MIHISSGFRSLALLLLLSGMWVVAGLGVLLTRNIGLLLYSHF